MFATLIISIIAVIFAWYSRFQNTKYGGLEISFILLTIFMSIRYNFGNDYQLYLDGFLQTARNVNIDVNDDYFEIGWLFLYWLFQPIGFFGMVIVLTVFEFAVIYRFIKKYVPKKWYWLSVLYFALDPSNMLVCGSMMRQFFAMCIFILSIDFIIEKKWVISNILIFIASLFHSSALILFPFCFFGFLNFKLKTKTALIWLGVYLILYILAVKLFGDYIFSLLKIEKFVRYEDYLGGEKDVADTGLGAIFYLILYVLIIFHQKFQNKSMRIIFLLFAMYPIFQVFEGVGNMIGRLGYYLNILAIICYPLMFKVIKNELIKNTVILVHLIVMVKTYIVFFNPKGIWYDSFYIYKTIFSVSSWM
jgi:hypothetical protein